MAQMSKERRFGKWTLKTPADFEWASNPTMSDEEYGKGPPSQRIRGPSKKSADSEELFLPTEEEAKAYREQMRADYFKKTGRTDMPEEEPFDYSSPRSNRPVAYDADKAPPGLFEFAEKRDEKAKMAAAKDQRFREAYLKNDAVSIPVNHEPGENPDIANMFGGSYPSQQMSMSGEGRLPAGSYAGDPDPSGMGSLAQPQVMPSLPPMGPEISASIFDLAEQQPDTLGGSVLDQDPAIAQTPAGAIKGAQIDDPETAMDTAEAVTKTVADLDDGSDQPQRMTQQEKRDKKLQQLKKEYDKNFFDDNVGKFLAMAAGTALQMIAVNNSYPGLFLAGGSLSTLAAQEFSGYKKHYQNRAENILSDVGDADAEQAAAFLEHVRKVSAQQGRKLTDAEIEREATALGLDVTSNSGLFESARSIGPSAAQGLISQGAEQIVDEHLDKKMKDPSFQETFIKMTPQERENWVAGETTKLTANEDYGQAIAALMADKERYQAMVDRRLNRTGEPAAYDPALKQKNARMIYDTMDDFFVSSVMGGIEPDQRMDAKVDIPVNKSPLFYGIKPGINRFGDISGKLEKNLMDNTMVRPKDHPDSGKIYFHTGRSLPSRENWATSIFRQNYSHQEGIKVFKEDIKVRTDSTEEIKKAYAKAMKEPEKYFTEEFMAYIHREMMLNGLGSYSIEGM